MYKILRRLFSSSIAKIDTPKVPDHVRGQESTNSSQNLGVKLSLETSDKFQDGRSEQSDQTNLIATKKCSPMNLSPLQLEMHSNRAVWALLIAIMHQRNGDRLRFKEYLELAQDWGCDKDLINNLVLSVAYDSTARASVLAKKSDLADRQSTKTLSLLDDAKKRLSSTYPEVFQALKDSEILKLDKIHKIPPEIGSYENPEEIVGGNNLNAQFHDLPNLLKPQRPIEVVDIGANPIDGTPPYLPILKMGICNITGFEPNERALAELNIKKSRSEKYFPHAIGDGQSHFINFYKASGMTSLYEVDEEKLKLFKFFTSLCESKNRTLIETHRIDDLVEISNIDFLKIDIQGGELAALKSGERKLQCAVAIQTEVSFITLYKGQPAFGEIDTYLRSRDFIPHSFEAIKRWPITPFSRKGAPKEPLNQLLEADIVYIKDISKSELFCDEQLKHLALIAHCCYSSYDLAMKCIEILVERNSIEKGSLDSYRKIVNSD